MNKYGKRILILFLTLFLCGIHTSYAIKITIKNNETKIDLEDGQIKKEVNIGEVFYFFSRFFEKQTPKSYKYIQLHFTGISTNTQLENALKILVYNDKINNSKGTISANKKINAYQFYKLAELILGTDISNINKDITQSRKVNSHDLELIRKSYFLIENKKKQEEKSMIERHILFQNVYNTIKESHYNKDEITDKELMYSAIEGLAKGTKDKHTVYFPPIKNKAFRQNLTGDYYGIGAYVDLKEPGNFVIVSPIPDSPAEKAGLKGGDRVLSADGKEITTENSLEEIISWIKGKDGTSVKLTILRGKERLEIKVKRGKIHISNMEYSIKENSAHYVKIKNFGNKSALEFKEILKRIKKENSFKKIIFDLRNNGGGFLDEVTKMLSEIVPEGKTTAVIKYIGEEKKYTSKGYNSLNLNDYEIVVLQNSGTASASEIMIGTIKDYFPHTVVIGEKSYGKGSVQTIKSYADGSSFKYTVAKWFTGKSETGIDGVGIPVDRDIKLDKEGSIDNQLKEALK